MAFKGGEWPLHDFRSRNASSEEILQTNERSEKFGAGSVAPQYQFNTQQPVEKTLSQNKRQLYITIGVIALALSLLGILIGALAASGVIGRSEKSSTNAELSTGGNATTSSSAIPSRTATSTSASATATKCPTASDIPDSAKNGWLDTTSWLTLDGFNCTFTDEMVGGLPIVGLNSTWDDSKQANPNVPPLNQSWGSYSAQPIRGVNLGGWFSLEPFITPSIYESVDAADEWHLTLNLGDKKKEVLEKHYATFYTEDDFAQMAAAGLTHVRIPYSYWAVRIYDNDPYLANVSWRYLLRAIEWARKYGLRVNLDLHAMPGSQNGWNHSGKIAAGPDWIIGADGAQNAQRGLDLHKQLSAFFAQPRYANVVAFYGLVNEPSKLIPMDQLNAWTVQAYNIIKGNGVNATQVFSESMRGLGAWQGQLQGYGNSLAIDVHSYMLFDDTLIGFKHVDRISFACNNFKTSVAASMVPGTGFGPTMTGEWSQADTDCVKYLNGYKVGNRWEGTFQGDGSKKLCNTQDAQCSCAVPNGDPGAWTEDYRKFLKTFAEAQMSAFEAGWGWFYWTWKTEEVASTQWSYQAGIKAGIMPAVAYQRDYACGQPIPSFGSLPEFY